MAGPDGDALAVEQLGDVVGVDSVEREADDARLVLGRGAEESHAADRCQHLVGLRGRAVVRAAWMASRPIAFR